MDSRFRGNDQRRCDNPLTAAKAGIRVTDRPLVMGSRFRGNDRGMAFAKPRRHSRWPRCAMQAWYASMRAARRMSREPAEKFAGAAGRNRTSALTV
jgi:hypothetical protein